MPARDAFATGKISVSCRQWANEAWALGTSAAFAEVFHMSNSLDILAEGRRRLRASAPSVTDEQFAAWAALARSRGATFELTLDGVVARYELESSPTRHQCAAISKPPTNFHELNGSAH